MSDLREYGWNPAWQEAYDLEAGPGLVPGRVVRQVRGSCSVVTPDSGVVNATPTGRMSHHASGPQDMPVVGDWVVVAPQDGRITAILPRRNAFTRKPPGNATEAQVIAANIDKAFLVSGLDNDYNPRRIERYLTAAWDSGTAPIIVLNKCDLCPNIHEVVTETESVALGVPIVVVSAEQQTGLDDLRRQIRPQETVVFLGMSGVGKSTLVNALLGEERLKTQDVRADDSRGRHTTTHRELFVLPDGGLVLDTPGMREFQLWDTGAGLHRTFEDIETLAEQCRFRDCKHEDEPGCAVQAAIAAGTLPADRLQGYRKLEREQRYIEARQNDRVRIEEKQRWKKIIVQYRKSQRHKS